MGYFTFLYRFCYKPFLADKLKTRGIFYEKNPNNRLRQCDKAYYITSAGYIYSNRLALLIEHTGSMETLKRRLEKYFDEFIVDEIQDIAGRDFSFLEQLMTANINMLFVGDFYQHTYDTSRDGNANKNLFDNFPNYEARFINRGFLSDKTSLVKSWRCSSSICCFITENLGIEIYSNQNTGMSSEASDIIFLSEQAQINSILANPNIVKLHFRNSSKYGSSHRNWGDTKGEDHYHGCDNIPDFFLQLCAAVIFICQRAGNPVPVSPGDAAIGNIPRIESLFPILPRPWRRCVSENILATVRTPD